MQIRELRQNRGISQEQLAEDTRLSLRTIQRVEAGHRVSYASLQALAAAFNVDVDSLERELYAMNTTQDEYIEKPLWARLLLALPILGRLDRSSLIRHEASLATYAVFAYAASFFLPRIETMHWGLTTVDLLHLSAFSALFVAYVASVMPRFREKYRPPKPTYI